MSPSPSIQEHSQSSRNQSTRATVSNKFKLVILALVIGAISVILAPRLASRGLKLVSQVAPAIKLASRSSFTATTTTASIAPVHQVRAAHSAHGVRSDDMPSREDREWNRLAVHMDQFHSHFRYEFERVYTLADGGFHKEGMSLPRFLREAQQLYSHLDMHHRIETYIFPVLAKKMPQFASHKKGSGEHLKKHKAIHDGLERYDRFLRDALEDSAVYDAGKLRVIMDGFKDVLFNHLDEEVHDLGAESMKAAGWTLDEIRRIPM